MHGRTLVADPCCGAAASWVELPVAADTDTDTDTDTDSRTLGGQIKYERSQWPAVLGPVPLRGCVGVFRVEGRDDSTTFSARLDTSIGTAEVVPRGERL